ncbi:hypothetical protein [Salegentibacter sediminis]|uniref:hypothetical protein n=1 Tax=Salegentibacter sediminis TaxID=1930251 RepID=UPI0009BDE5AD|nr:hypothetical protein [Salegentibacter sediminis]
MKNLRAKGKKWAKRALALKLGKTAVKKGGILGVGLGAAAGAVYLAWNYNKKCKKLKAEEDAANEITVKKEKKIVV